MLRIADPYEMRRQMPQRVYAGWQRYWIEEPWGPFRDNLHAAIVAREVSRPYLRKGQKRPLDDFIVTNPQRRQVEAGGKLIDFLKMTARKVERG